MHLSTISRKWALVLGLIVSCIHPSNGRSINVRQIDTLQWGPCVKPLQWGEPSSLVCANFTVPLDWTNTSNGQKAVLSKLKAKSGTSRGTIFVNPGGPGGSGFEFLHESGSELLSNMTRGNFDIVSWDPRGVGLTQPAIDCFDPQGNQTANEAALESRINLLYSTLNARSTGPDQSDTDKFLASATTIESYVQNFMQSCMDNNQENLKYVGTVSTVKDLVALVDAIEGPGSLIRYWGVSYGTIIGSYLLDRKRSTNRCDFNLTVLSISTVFPDRVGRVVLDGIVDSTIYSQKPPYQSYGDNVQDADMALQAFYDACAAAGPELCPISSANSTGATIRQWANDLIDLAYRGGENGTSLVTPTVIRSQLSSAARSPMLWEETAQLLQIFYHHLHNIQGSKVIIATPSSRHFNRLSLTKRQGPEYPFATYISSQHAIWCGDAADETGVTTTTVFNDLIRVTKDISNIEGPIGLSYPTAFCHIWKSRAIERHYDQGSPRLANPVLVIGNTYDMITPLASARKLVRRLNDVGTRQAALIQHDGTGHTSWEMNSVCTYTIVQRYFIDGVFPEDTLCGTNFKGFTGNPAEVNHNTSTSTISSPLSSSSEAPQGSGNGTVARASITIFQLLFPIVLGLGFALFTFSWT
ncbi:hypothetical protein FRC02_011933 [Tulasnella sp. 418]|nr:hypothetical protein FRC02_011933 [Tulasnella sp. 418]